MWEITNIIEIKVYAYVVKAGDDELYWVDNREHFIKGKLLKKEEKLIKFESKHYGIVTARKMGLEEVKKHWDKIFIIPMPKLDTEEDLEKFCKKMAKEFWG